MFSTYYCFIDYYLNGLCWGRQSIMVRYKAYRSLFLITGATVWYYVRLLPMIYYPMIYYPGFYQPTLSTYAFTPLLMPPKKDTSYEKASTNSSLIRRNKGLIRLRFCWKSILPDIFPSNNWKALKSDDFNYLNLLSPHSLWKTKGTPTREEPRGEKAAG